jgi:phosphatidylethanolamine/phosphatidyl-N-methylethanolamine N-methyltransferase
MKSDTIDDTGLHGVRQRARNVLADLTFFFHLLRSPKHTGAIAASGPTLARTIAEQIDPDAPGTVMELGPGTGPVTEALLARGVPLDRLVVVEVNADFRRHLARRFPGLRIIDGDAFKIADIVRDHGIDDLSAVVSCLPLLHWPGKERQGLLRQALSLMPPGSPFVQFTYSPESSIAADPSSYVSERSRRVWRNLPPATVWTYRSADSGADDVAA